MIGRSEEPRGPTDQSRRCRRREAGALAGRRSIAERLSPDELRHVAFLAMTILGLPKAVAALTWIEDIVEEGGNP